MRTTFSVAMAFAALALVVTPARAQTCVGDCHDTGTVSISDLILGVNIALGRGPASFCFAFQNSQGAVDIAQLIKGVRNALHGCGAATAHLTDNGDGTITDQRTALMWEKKVRLDGVPDVANLHDADNVYAWSWQCGDFYSPVHACQPSASEATVCSTEVSGYANACAECMDGDGCNVTDTIWTWIVALNAANFAGYADWRMPTRPELESIIDYAKTQPLTDSVFSGTSCGPECTEVSSASCSCTQSGMYWSASVASHPADIYQSYYPCGVRAGDRYVNLYTCPMTVDFFSGVTMEGNYDQSAFVRAVRDASPPMLCGNGRLDADEACDDGDTAAGDGCSPQCVIEPGYSCYNLSVGGSFCFIFIGQATATGSPTPTITPMTPIPTPTITPTRTAPPTPTPHLVDNGDGTITDQQTGLMWEKKVKLDGIPDVTNPHDADNEYGWSGQCSINPGNCQPSAAAAAACTDVDGGAIGCGLCRGGDGTCDVTATIWTWVLALNAANFAGHADWRVPTVTELESIFNRTVYNPAVDVAFQGASCGGACTDVTNAACSCTQSSWYWSSTTSFGNPTFAWVGYFGSAFASDGSKTSLSYVRAVRGGS